MKKTVDTQTPAVTPKKTRRPKTIPNSPPADDVTSSQAQGFQPQDIGKTIKGKGIYLGVWVPKDQEGLAVGAFDIFAAPDSKKSQNTAEKKRSYSCYPVQGTEMSHRPKITQQAQGLEPEDIGKAIEGKGIYLGVWLPKDQDGLDVGSFDVFAAPEDVYRQNNDAQKIGIKYYSLYYPIQTANGLSYGDALVDRLTSETHIYAALRDGSGVGKWFIPPRELVNGKDQNGKIVRAPHLYALRNQGAFQRTFSRYGKTGDASDWSDWYWTSTEIVGPYQQRYAQSLKGTYGVSFSERGGDLLLKGRDAEQLNLRLCRVEPRPREEVEAQLKTAKYQIQSPSLSTNAPRLAYEDIGKTIAGKGIFMGVWTPSLNTEEWEATVRASGKTRKKFYVYVAPTDVQHAYGSQGPNQKELAPLISSFYLLGHGCVYLSDADALYKALADGSALGKWFIPPFELVNGTEVYTSQGWGETMFTHRNNRDFRETFGKAIPAADLIYKNARRQGRIYWSCTTDSDSGTHFATRFSDGKSFYLKDSMRAHVRLCRVEVIEGAPPAYKGTAEYGDNKKEINFYLDAHKEEQRKKAAAARESAPDPIAAARHEGIMQGYNDAMHTAALTRCRR